MGKDAHNEDTTEIRTAAEQGRHADALDAMQMMLFQRALRMFALEGVTFEKQHENVPPLDSLNGLASAAEDALAGLGEKCTARAKAAARIIQTIASLHSHLAELPDRTRLRDWTAKLVMIGGAIGELEQMSKLIVRGELDLLAHASLLRKRQSEGGKKAAQIKKAWYDSAFVHVARDDSGSKKRAHATAASRVNAQFGDRVASEKAVAKAIERNRERFAVIQDAVNTFREQGEGGVAPDLLSLIQYAATGTRARQ